MSACSYDDRVTRDFARHVFDLVGRVAVLEHRAAAGPIAFADVAAARDESDRLQNFGPKWTPDARPRLRPVVDALGQLSDRLDALELRTPEGRSNALAMDLADREGALARRAAALRAGPATAAERRALAAEASHLAGDAAGNEPALSARALQLSNEFLELARPGQ